MRYDQLCRLPVDRLVRRWHRLARVFRETRSLNTARRCELAMLRTISAIYRFTP